MAQAKKSNRKETAAKEQTVKQAITNYRDIPLNQGELSRIIIVQGKNGAITTLTKSSGARMSFPEAIGLLEIAKSEAIASVKQQGSPEVIKNDHIDPALLKETEIILDALDQEMDVDGMIEKQGLKVDGKPIKVSIYASKMREKRRANYLAQKNPEQGVSEGK